MPTYYKPSVDKKGRGVIFRSFDPDEPKRSFVACTLMLVAFLIWGLICTIVLSWPQKP